jgi:hypothetical protein
MLSPHPGTQLRVLLWLTLQDVLREGVDPSTGARVTPIKHLLFSMGFIGLMFAAGVSRYADLESFAVHLAAATMWLTALLVMPDPLDVRERKLELFRSKPIANVVLLRARVLSLLAIAALVVSSMVILPIGRAVFLFGATPWLVLSLWLALVAGAFAAVLLWLGVVFVLARRFTIARVRAFSQLVLVLSIVTVMGLSALVPLQGGALKALPFVAWLPSSWFALLGLGSWRDGLAALGLLVVATVTHLRLDVDRCYDKLDEPAPDASPWAFGELGARVARLLLPAQAAAVADLTMRVLAREEMARVRTVAPRVVQVLLCGFALWSKDPLAPIAMLAGYAFFCVAEGLSTASRASQPAASWLLFSAPVRPSRSVLGLGFAVLARETVLPALLLAIVCLVQRPPLAALLLVFAFLVTAVALLAFLLAASPRLPLASEQRVWPGLGGLLGLNLLGMVAAATYAVLVALTGFGGFGTVAAALLVVPVALTAVACAWIAGRRAPTGDFIQG